MDNLSFENELLEALDQEQQLNINIMFHLQQLIANWHVNRVDVGTCKRQLNALYSGDFKTLEKELKLYSIVLGIKGDLLDSDTLIAQLESNEC